MVSHMVSVRQMELSTVQAGHHLVSRTGLFDNVRLGERPVQLEGKSSWTKVGAGEVRAVNLNPDATIDE